MNQQVNTYTYSPINGLERISSNIVHTTPPPQKGVSKMGRKKLRHIATLAAIMRMQKQKFPVTTLKLRRDGKQLPPKTLLRHVHELAAVCPRIDVSREKMSGVSGTRCFVNVKDRWKKKRV